jgi:hypothetical protein
MIDLDPILGKIPWSMPAHAGPMRQSGTSSASEIDFTEVSHDYILENDVVRFGQTGEFVNILCEIGLAFQDQLHLSLIETLSDSTERSGTSLDLNGQPVSWDIFLQLLEQADFQFGPDNMMLGEPTVMMSPEVANALAQITRPPDFEERVNRILGRKLESYLAEKRTRRLSE